MSPAKATRPGFRQSMMSDPARADLATINLFHPVYHTYTYPIGCRTDIERLLPPHLEDEDTEELIDNFSEPPVWLERFSPLAVQVGDQVIRAKNAPELMLKLYRVMFDVFNGIGRFIESTLTQNAGEEAVRFPFMSISVDPDTIHRLIESDYESGETGYSNLMKLFAQGTVSPCLTTPFYSQLTKIASEDELRICVRSSFIFYRQIIELYSEFLKKNGETGLMVIPFWLPDGAYSNRVVTIITEEFHDFCKKAKLGTGHLVFLLDNHQSDCIENDILMKSWNQIEWNGTSNGRSRGREKKLSLHPGVSNLSVVFRDRSFSDWVIHANPSVKKLLDRTIAKVDSDLNAQNVHYGWAHFEELEAITYTPRALLNFQQKLIKLTELGYLPLSPDFYVRGKLRGEFGCAEQEPQMIRVFDKSVGNGWDLEDSLDDSRWVGLSNGNGSKEEPHSVEGETEDKPLVPQRPYKRVIKDGLAEEKGCACWKIAWEKVRQTCHQAVVGDLSTLEGGMAEVLVGLTKQSDPAKVKRNVHDFLAHYTYVYWREHFIQHDLAEADINILEISNKHLRAGIRGDIDIIEAAKAGAAAQAIYFALDSTRSIGTASENMDERAFYQNVVMLTLAICNAIAVYTWLDDTESAQKLLTLLKTELIDFENAYDRYDLAQYEITAEGWADTIKSEIEDSEDNVVKRAALRTAARHLRPLGFTKDFTRQEANLTTNVSHIWATESCRENFCYENKLFCGVSEE